MVRRYLYALGLIACALASTAAVYPTAYHLVREDGSDLPHRFIMNFTGAGVTCTDDAAGNETECAIPGGGGSGYATVQEEGAGLTQRPTINFIGASVTCVDNAGSTRTDCTVTGGGGGLDHAAVMARQSLGF